MNTGIKDQGRSKAINRYLKDRPVQTLSCLILALFILVILLYRVYLRVNEQIIHFDSIQEPIVNPLMGWAPWATIKEIHQPHSLVYADLTWREFEPREGFYDFATFEEKQQLARWRREGQRVVFRFVADQPRDQEHIDIPDWLFDKIQGSGDFYDNEYGMGFSPEYSNPIFIDYHRKAITALGARYGGDGFFAFIELGSLGHWGEWHTHPDITPLPAEEITNLYVNHYLEAFPGIHLMMRRPFKIARTFDLGLYNDMTAEPQQTGIWLDWIAVGSQHSSQEVDRLAAMPNGWQQAPIGGEQAPDLSDEQVYAANLGQTIELLRRSHTTFIGPNGPYNVEYGSSLQDGLDQVMTTIGYRIYIDQIQTSRRVLFGKTLHIKFTFANGGTAPMYYNWPVWVYLLDQGGNTLSSFPLPMDLRKILPNEFLDIVFDMPVQDLKNGTYMIGIAIIDPIARQPAVRFANENRRPDLIQYLGWFEIKRMLNSN